MSNTPLCSVEAFYFFYFLLFYSLRPHTHRFVDKFICDIRSFSYRNHIWMTHTHTKKYVHSKWSRRKKKKKNQAKTRLLKPVALFLLRFCVWFVRHVSIVGKKAIVYFMHMFFYFYWNMKCFEFRFGLKKDRICFNLTCVSVFWMTL